MQLRRYSREGVPGFSAVFRWIFFYDSFFKGFSKVPKGSPYNKKTPRGRGFPVSIDPPCVFVTMSNFLFGIVKPKSCRVICIYIYIYTGSFFNEQVERKPAIF